MLTNKFCKTICPCLFSLKKQQNQVRQEQQGKLTDPSKAKGDHPDSHSGSSKKLSIDETESTELKQTSMCEDIKDSTVKNVNSSAQQQGDCEAVPKQQIVDMVEMVDYCQYLEKAHPYKNILIDKLLKLNDLFNIPHEGAAIKTPTDYNLQLRIASSENKKTNIFSYSFQFPTSYKFYERMVSDYDMQKHFDTNISQYYCMEKIDQQTKTIYLSYKRVVIIAPRDFVYIRYNFIHGEEHWSVATSLPDAEAKQGRCRGDIMLTATRVVPTEKGIKVSVYSHVDMKISIKGDMTRNRGAQEIKKYLDRCYQHVLENGTSLLDNDLDL